jgi:phage terminase large subunit
LARWRYDPVAFSNDALGIPPWELQAAVMMAVVEHHQVAVRSGHKIGKSLLVAILALWWAVCWPHGKVLITAPTGAQVKDIVWAELRQLVLRANRLGVIAVPEASKVPDGGIRWDDGRIILGRSTDKGDRIQGYSGPANLYLIDEASGVANDIYEALIGNTAGGSADDDSAVAKFVLTGNPTQTTGRFYDAFTRLAPYWRTFTISSAETPNAREGRVVIPGLATRDYVERLRDQYGEDSDLYRVRVLGRFPKQGANSVIAVTAIEAAARRWREMDEDDAEGALRIGVDVARFGDDASAVAALRGTYTYPIETARGLETTAVAELTLQVVRKRRRSANERPKVKVDTIGIGAGVADILRQSSEVEVIDINVAEKSDSPDDYPKLRDQLWFEMGKWLADGGTLPDNDQLEGELGAPTYKIDLQGRQKVESKDETKKKLGRSPDLADALMLAIYPGRVAPKPTVGDASFLPF